MNTAVRSVASGKGVRAQLLRGGIWTLLIRSTSVLLALALSIVLARTMGAEGYGVYAYVLSLVTILAVPAQFGLPQLLVRETAKARVHQQWSLMVGVWRWGAKAATMFSIGLALIAATVAAVFSGLISDLQLATLAWALALVPLMVLGQLRDAALRGLHKIVKGQLSESIVRPAVLLVLIGIVINARMPLTADRAMALHALAAVIAFAAGAWLLNRSRPEQLKARVTPEYRAAEWRQSVLPLALSGGMQLINKHADIIILGIFASAADVGVYRVVMQGALLVAFGLQSMNLVIAPEVAKLYSQNKIAELQKLVTLTARIIVLLTTPIVLLFVVFGEQILGFVYGAEYARGHTALAILAGGQVANAFFGSVGLLLNMTGHERDMARGVAVAAASNIVLNVLFIPLFGIEGAAFSTALTTLIWNVVLWRMVGLRLEVDSTAIGFNRSGH